MTPQQMTNDAPTATPTGAARPARPIWRERAAVGALLALAAALRLTLAARGWPILNSDEAAMGLMGSDILSRGSHPVFIYTEDYIGALVAYLAAPVDALFGPTPFALRVVTTGMFVAFMLVVYALARAVWSPAVGMLSLALLALGPEWGLLRQMQAGAGVQDTLLFGALVVYLAFLRLRSAHVGWRPLALDALFGLAVGLGLWGDFLFLPYVAAALLALGWLGWREGRSGALGARRIAGEVAFGLAGFLLGAAPFILANISSHGQTLRHVVELSQAHTGAASPGLVERLGLLVNQIGATLLVALPQTLGSVIVCPGCAVWPQQGVSITAARLAQELLLAAPFSLLAIGLWLWTALPLARAIRRRLPLDARAWGRLMLTLGGALTLLQYMVSRTSYTFPASSARYLIGLYICAPLVAAPLVAAAHVAWRNVGAGHVAPASLRVVFGAPLGVALLLLTLVVTGASGAHALAVTADHATYGEPMGQRDARLVAFLQAHHAKNFYAGYWTCVRLVFTSQQRVNCSVITQDSAFAPGFNRYPPAVRRTLADPHAAWVFDLARGDEAPSVPAQVVACIASGNPRCAGYTSATQDDYLIYYYAGAAEP